MIKERKIKLSQKVNPIQILVMGYFFVTLIFALLLMLPISSVNHKTQPLIDAIFMASSGISTTGLTVVDIGSFYSLFGQIILMLDFQIGGIGYMAFIVFIVYLLNIKLSMKNQIIATESVSGSYPSHIFIFFKKVIVFTLLFELIGGLILFFYWLPGHSLPYALYLGIFHSVSAFCTAGFCLFPTSVMLYKNSLVINFVIGVVSLAGGIGFYVLNEIYMVGKKIIKRERYRISDHTKLVIVMTALVIFIGTVVIFVSEKWTPTITLKERLMVSSFQAISASTTDGYNSVDIGAMSFTSLFMIILLMFIGASPGSTGGGIKTTTAGVVFLSVWSTLKGEKDNNIFGRRISGNIIKKSFAIFVLFIMIAIIDLLILTLTEKAGFLQIIFEIISALGNTGLSMGITANLSSIAKILLSITMFIGRVGPLVIGVALVRKLTPANFRYPEADIFVG